MTGCINVKVFETSPRSRRKSGSRSNPRCVELLETRELLATFTVTNLNPFGSGSLRQAIIASNKRPGPDTIDFAVAGTIRAGQASLPAITDTVLIDGSSAPGFAGSPVVTVNFQGSKGLSFAKGSDGSTLESLSLVKAGNAGVTLSASHITVQGNFIGLLADGKTVAGNRGDGVQINASSRADLIGQQRSGYLGQLFQCRCGELAAGLGMAGHSRLGDRRPVLDRRHVGLQRAALRGADQWLRRHELFGQLSRRFDHEHERVRPRYREREHPASGREL